MIKKRKSIIGKLFSFKLFFLAVMLVIVIFGPALGSEFYRNYQIEKEIESLKNEIDTLDKNNYQLSKLVEYYNTDQFKEREARTRLNLKKEGENLAIIKQSGVDLKKTDVSEEEAAAPNLPNYRKWWNYFFEDKGK